MALWHCLSHLRTKANRAVTATCGREGTHAQMPLQHWMVQLTLLNVHGSSRLLQRRASPKGLSASNLGLLVNRVQIQEHDLLFSTAAWFSLALNELLSLS